MNANNELRFTEHVTTRSAGTQLPSRPRTLFLAPKRERMQIYLAWKEEEPDLRAPLFQLPRTDAFLRSLIAMNAWSADFIEQTFTGMEYASGRQRVEAPP
jgi:hypothetical protein